MASTVELFDGYKFEIAGSVQFPTARWSVSSELGLDTLPTIDLDVMSVAMRGVGDDPLVQYTDPMQAVHPPQRGARGGRGQRDGRADGLEPGADAGAGPVRRRRSRRRRSTRCMPARQTNSNAQLSTTCCSDRSPTSWTATSRTARSTARCAGSLTVLAVNTTLPRTGHAGQRRRAGLRAGRSRRGHDADEEAARRHRRAHRASRASCSTADGGELRLRTKVTEIAGRRRPGDRRAHRGGRPRSTAPIVVSCVAPDLTLNDLIDPAALPADVRERYLPHRPPRQLRPDALRAGRGPGVRRAVRGCSTTRPCRRPSACSARRRKSSSSGRTAVAGSCPADPTVAFQIPSQNDPDLAPPGKHAASAFALWFPIEGDADYGAAEGRDGSAGDRQDHPARTELRSAASPGTPPSRPSTWAVMFGAPGGDYCHGLVHPEQIGPEPPGPERLSRPADSGIDGLYLGSAGCHGGPGITFIPGYNAARAALSDRRSLAALVSSSSSSAVNSSGRAGVNAGLGRVPGTSRVISVDRNGRRTSSGSQRRRSELPQMRNRCMNRPSGSALYPRIRVQRDDLRGAGRESGSGAT